MTAEECRVAIGHLSPKIDNYAELLVRKGAALRRGQELVLQAPVERADFARRVVRKAYEAGAGHVTVIWSDDVVGRLTYEHLDKAYFEHVPSWQREQLNSLAEAGAAFLFLEGSDPSALDGIDPAKPAAARKARNTECLAFREGMDFGRNVWCIAGVPVEAWAREVFPELSGSEAVYRLWLAILSVARSDGRDPQSAWETHNATFEKNKRLLNAAAYDSLRYRSSNGTDLVVGMNAGHLWEGGAARTVDGTVFFPNIPTEEVFTTPTATVRRESSTPPCRSCMRARSSTTSGSGSETARRSSGTPVGARPRWTRSWRQTRVPITWERSPSSQRTPPSGRVGSSSTTRSTTRTRAATSPLAWDSRSVLMAGSTWARTSSWPTG